MQIFFQGTFLSFCATDLCSSVHHFFPPTLLKLDLEIEILSRCLRWNLGPKMCSLSGYEFACVGCFGFIPHILICRFFITVCMSFPWLLSQSTMSFRQQNFIPLQVWKPAVSSQFHHQTVKALAELVPSSGSSGECFLVFSKF